MNQKTIFNSLKRLVKSIGAELFFDNAFHGIGGMLMCYKKNIWIVINKKLSLAKQNFVIAHELAHFTLEHTGYSTEQLFYSEKTKKKKIYSAIEDEADSLAYEIIQSVSGQLN
ncbi:MAG: ImmA/IrrE family metallo-endopeptidase [Caldisericia bacterium]